MNYKKVFLIFALVVLFVALIGCAETADTVETAAETETTEESAADYDPEVVDQLTEDLDEMSWQLHMKKLLINGLLILVFIALLVAVIMGLSKLRAVDTSDAEVDDLIEGQEQAVADEKAVQEQTAVKVSVSNTTANKTNTSKTTTSNSKSTSSKTADIDDFLNELG